MVDLQAPFVQKAKDCQLVAIGGSAGSLTGIIEWVSLSAGPAWVVIMHRNPQQKSLLVKLLQHYSRKKVKEAEEGEPIDPGFVYIAPAGKHLILRPDLTWNLEDSAPVWFCKPSIDKLYRSLAGSLGNRAMGILLSGANEDGARGLFEIHRQGGLCLAEDPAHAEYPMMPEAAVRMNAHDLLFQKESVAGLGEQLFGL